MARRGAVRAARWLCMRACLWAARVYQPNLQLHTALPYCVATVPAHVVVRLRVRVRVRVRVRASWNTEGHGAEFTVCAEVRDLMIIPILAVSLVWSCGILYLLFKWRASPLNAMWPCRALLVVVAFCWLVHACVRLCARAHAWHITWAWPVCGCVHRKGEARETAVTARRRQFSGRADAAGRG